MYIELKDSGDGLDVFLPMDSLFSFPSVESRDIDNYALSSFHPTALVDTLNSCKIRFDIDISRYVKQPEHYHPVPRHGNVPFLAPVPPHRGSIMLPISAQRFIAAFLSQSQQLARRRESE